MFTGFSMIVSADQMSHAYQQAGKDPTTGAFVGAGIGLASSLMGYAMGGAFAFPGIIPGALSGAISGGLVGGYTGGFANTLLGGDFWSGAKAGGFSGAIAGGIMGAINGYDAAKEEGRNPWTGGASFETKSGYFLASHDNALRAMYGDELVDKTDISYTSRSKLRYRAFGQTNELDDLSGQKFNNVEGHLSEIKISKPIVRMYWRNQNIKASTVIFHEFDHVQQNFSGWRDFLDENFGELNSRYLLEYNTYEKMYNLFGTGLRGVNYYKPLYENNWLCY
jgi:hypothetical protein